ncbi:hypothetical protein F9K33_00355 [bacterium]|nr:MAG: hypothetical protein F9K33_00355 [bacterium]
MSSWYYRCRKCGCKFKKQKSSANTFIPFWALVDGVTNKECPSCESDETDIISYEEYSGEKK